MRPAATSAIFNESRHSEWCLGRSQISQNQSFGGVEIPSTQGPESASRPGESHPQALLEPCMNLSTHTAPDVQPMARTSNDLASSRGSSCRQLAPVFR